MVRYLAQRGAKLNLKDKKGRNELALAAIYRHTKAAEVLKEYGATV